MSLETTLRATIWELFSALTPAFNAACTVELMTMLMMVLLHLSVVKRHIFIGHLMFVACVLMFIIIIIIFP